MTYRLLLALALLALALFACEPSRADSDGNFCTSRGYLAYELRKGITPNVSGHVLRVVRFEPKLGIYNAGEVTLEDFQVHAMNCSQDRIEVSGWSNAFVKYTVDVAGPDHLRTVESTKDPARRFDPSKEGPAPLQLALGPARTVVLESDDPNHKYELRLIRVLRSVEGGSESNSRGELVQVDLHGAISRRLVLQERQFVESGE